MKIENVRTECILENKMCGYHKEGDTLITDTNVYSFDSVSVGCEFEEIEKVFDGTDVGLFIFSEDRSLLNKQIKRINNYIEKKVSLFTEKNFFVTLRTSFCLLSVNGKECIDLMTQTKYNVQNMEGTCSEIYTEAFREITNLSALNGIIIGSSNDLVLFIQIKIKEEEHVKTSLLCVGCLGAEDYTTFKTFKKISDLFQGNFSVELPYRDSMFVFLSSPFFGGFSITTCFFLLNGKEQKTDWLSLGEKLRTIRNKVTIRIEHINGHLVNSEKKKDNETTKINKMKKKHEAIKKEFEKDLNRLKEVLEIRKELDELGQREESSVIEKELSEYEKLSHEIEVMFLEQKVSVYEEKVKKAECVLFETRNETKEKELSWKKKKEVLEENIEKLKTENKELENNKMFLEKQKKKVMEKEKEKKEGTSKKEVPSKRGRLPKKIIKEDFEKQEKTFSDSLKKTFEARADIYNIDNVISHENSIAEKNGFDKHISAKKFPENKQNILKHSLFIPGLRKHLQENTIKQVKKEEQKKPKVNCSYSKLFNIP